MIIDELSLTNFGLFNGHQSIALTPASPEKPVILFGGLNGGGKTTLLDAIQLCLYGAFAKTSTRGTLKYSDYLERCIHDKVETPKAGIEMRFRHTVEGKEDQYTLKRDWHRVNGACKETFLVLRNKRLEPTLAENWASQVEDLLPTNIAHLFLFDGEQIEGYASPSDSASLIETAVQSLLGLDLVDQLEKDLRVFVKKKKVERADDATRIQIDSAESELLDLRQQVQTLKQGIAALESHQLDPLRRQLVKAEKQFQVLGGDLFDQREQIRADLGSAETALNANSEGLREIASGPLPISLAQSLIRSAAATDQSDIGVYRARELSKVLGERDRSILQHLSGGGCEEAELDALKSFLEADRKLYEQQASGEVQLGLTPESRGSLYGLIQGGIDGEHEKLTQLLEERRDLVDEVNRVRTLYESIPDSDVVRDVIDRRDAIEGEIADLETKRGTTLQEIEWLEQRIERREDSLVGMLEADVQNESLREDRDRFVGYAAKVRSTLGRYREEVVNRHLSRIESLVLESLQSLLRKTSLVTSLRIDPVDFSLKLFGQNQEVLGADRLSAGERQLLGVALLWGLAKTSGRPLPTAIDTPLGRLDKGHRMHFIERYLPFASHQTLLFSTDEEIVGQYLDRLRPWVGRSYHLNYCDRNRETRVVSGYFGSQGDWS